MNDNEQLTLRGDEAGAHSIMVNVNDIKQHLSLWLKRDSQYLTSLYHCPPELALASLIFCWSNQGDPLHLAYMNTCWLHPPHHCLANIKETAQSYCRQQKHLEEALCRGMAHAELKPWVIALRIWDAVAWCGRRMQHHVYSHLLRGVPSWQHQRHYSEHYLRQTATKEMERKAVLFCLYIWLLNSRLRYFAAGRTASA